MLNNEAYIELSKSLREAGIKGFSSWEDESRKQGRFLADLWIKNKAKTIDLWGVDGFGEEFTNAFLELVMEVHGNLDDVDDIQWYYGCETGNFGLPLYFLNAIWIANFSSKNKIQILHPECTLERMARNNFGSFVKATYEELNTILESIMIDEHGDIQNADEISLCIAMAYNDED